MAKMEVGMKMPNFRYDTGWEQDKDFYLACKKGAGKKTVLRFLRYYGCTVCQLDTWELAEEYQRFVDAGANLFVVMQSDPSTIRDEVKEGDLPYDLICDPTQSLYKMLEIGNVADMEPSAYKLMRRERVKARGMVHGKYEGNEKQAPAMFIMDEDMNVVYAHYGIESTDLPSIDETIELLKK